MSLPLKCVGTTHRTTLRRIILSNRKVNTAKDFFLQQTHWSFRHYNKKWRLLTRSLRRLFDIESTWNSR